MVLETIEVDPRVIRHRAAINHLFGHWEPHEDRFALSLLVAELKALTFALDNLAGGAGRSIRGQASDSLVSSRAGLTSTPRRRNSA
jgi:hypothetical protein